MEFTRKNANKIRQLFQETCPPDQTVIEFATAKLSICPIANNPNKQFKKIAKEGIICVVINRSVPALYLQLYDYLSFKKIFEIELYSNIEEGYHCSKNNLFHSIEFPGFFLGMCFVDKDNHKKSISSSNLEGNKNEGENSASLIRKAIITTSKYLNIDFPNFVYDNDSSAKGQEAEVIKEKKKQINDILVRESADTTIYEIIKFPEIKKEEGFENGINKEHMERFYGKSNALVELLTAYAENNRASESEDEDETEENMHSTLFDHDASVKYENVKGVLLEDEKSDEEKNEKEKELQQKIMKLKKISTKPEPEEEKTTGKVTLNPIQLALLNRRKRMQEEKEEDSDESSDF